MRRLCFVFLPGLLMLLNSSFIAPCDPFHGSLKTHDGKTYALKPPVNRVATVFVFLLPDCPASQSYTLTLNTLSKKYQSKQVQFLGIVPGTYATAAEVKAFVKTYKVSFPVLADTAYKLVRCLGATIVPEAFVVDRKGVTQYAGRIDNWLVSAGKKRNITTHELDDAITAVINKKPVKVKKTKAIGCYIE